MVSIPSFGAFIPNSANPNQGQAYYAVTPQGKENTVSFHYQVSPDPLLYRNPAIRVLFTSVIGSSEPGASAFFSFASDKQALNRRDVQPDRHSYGDFIPASIREEMKNDALQIARAFLKSDLDSRQ